MTDTTTETNEDTAGLKAKNSELLGKLKKSEADLKTLTDRLTALEEDRDEALDTSKSEADKDRAKLQRQIDKLIGDVASRDARLGELLIDNSIKEAITTNNVLPHYAKAVEAMLRAGAKIVNGEAVSADGLPLTDANAAFFTSADAKHFVAAPANTGGGAQGSTAKGTVWSKPPQTAAELDAWDREAINSPAEYNARAEAWGRVDLKV